MVVTYIPKDPVTGLPVTKHQRYVAKGYCSSRFFSGPLNDTSAWEQTWCVQRDGHAGEHWSLKLRDGMMEISHRWG